MNFKETLKFESKKLGLRLNDECLHRFVDIKTIYRNIIKQQI